MGDVQEYFSRNGIENRRDRQPRVRQELKHHVELPSRRRDHVRGDRRAKLPFRSCHDLETRCSEKDPIRRLTHCGADQDVQERPGIVVLVKDAGVGIASEVLPHVFEPFYTTGKRHGTGLGLAICRNIIESHGGDIHMTSEPGKGTSVRIWLPLSQDAQAVKG
jgi:signal transduction histidine kinase